MPTASITRIKQLVVDASVAVKWFSKEAHTNKAERILKRAVAGGLEISAPDLLVYEVGNAFWKGKGFSQEIIAASLETIFDSPLKLVPASPELVKPAIIFMVKYNLTFYDAVYAGLAFLFNAPLLTANPKDQQQVKEIIVIDIARV